MKLVYSVLLLFFLSGSIVFPQFIPGAKNASLGFSDLTGYNDKFSLFSNPASIASYKNNHAAVFFSPSPFGLKELVTSSATTNYHSIYGNIAIAATRYGFDLYNETKFLAAYAGRFIPDLYTGITLEMRKLTIANYGNTSAFNMIFGLTYIPYKNISIACVLNNPFGFSYKNTSGQIPTTISLGFGMLFGDLIKLTASLEDETDRDLSFAYGMELFLHEYITIRAGNNSGFNMLTFGLGINYLYLGVNYAVLLHDELGYTHQAEIYVEF